VKRTVKRLWTATAVVLLVLFGLGMLRNALGPGWVDTAGTIGAGLLLLVALAAVVMTIVWGIDAFRARHRAARRAAGLD
jgi:hypothetical protein